MSQAVRDSVLPHERGGSQQARPAGIVLALGWAVPVVLLLALWLSTRPYSGIVHDARLYMVQALNAAYPGRFAEDLYFKYGSQDSFSAFSLLYKPVVEALGVGRAHMVATILGLGLWFATALGLLLSFFRDRRTAFAAMVGVTLLYSGYGGLGIFRYGEPFASPRLFAEAGVMAALTATLLGRTIMAWALVVLAAAIHPIMGLTGAAVLGAASVRGPRAWGAMAVIGAAVVVCAILRWGPFGRLLLGFDDPWFEVVRQRCRFAFPTQWRLDDWFRIAAQSAILAVFATLANAKERAAIALVGSCSLIALVLTGIGADLGRDILLVNIQAWRILWLLAFFSNAAAAVILIRLPTAGASRPLFAALFSIELIGTLFGMPAMIASLLAIYCCGIFAWEYYKKEPLPRFMTVILSSVLVAGSIVAVLFVAISSRSDNFGSLVIRSLVIVATVALVATPRIWFQPIVLVLGCALFGLSALDLDQRDRWARMVEASGPVPGLEAFLSGSGNVYWEGERGLELLWLKAARPGYYSCLQGTGAMFYRNTALEYARRSNALANLNTSDFVDSDGDICTKKSDIKVFGPSGIADVEKACSGLPELDSLVLMRELPGALPSRRWTAPAYLTVHRKDGRKERIQTFYQYRCSELG